MPKFGPGTFKIGETATALDVSCAVNSLVLEPSKDTSDPKTMLCGTVKPGRTTYTYVASGNVDVDSDDPSGFFAYCEQNAGRQVPFSYTPSNGGTEASGTLVLDPLSFGGEEYGEDMASDFEFDVVGRPTYVYPSEARAAADVQAFKPLVVYGKDTAATAAPVAAQPAPEGGASLAPSSQLSADDASPAPAKARAKQG